MSVGDVPLTDEDLLALRQPPSIVPPLPAPVYGPPTGPAPAPDFIDQVNSQPLATPSAGKLPDEAAFPPPVPSEAPGMVPVAPKLPTPVPPPAPGARPGEPETAKTPLDKANADVKTAGADAEKARAVANDAEMAAAESGGALAHENAQLEGDRVVNQRLEQQDREDAAARYDAADAKAQQAVDQAAKARKDFTFRGYWADRSSTARIAGALFQALGAFGAGMTRGPNFALQILSQDMEDDHRSQVEKLQQLRDDEVQAKTGVADAREARKQALLGIQVNAAQADAMIAAQMKAAAAKSTDETFQTQVNAFAAKMQQASAQKMLEARAAVRDDLIKQMDDEAKRAETAARTRLLNAQADAGGFSRGRGKGGGGGGGAGVGGDAVSQLKAAIEAGKDGRPLTAGEIQDAANALHIPAFAKAGHPSVEAITKSVAFVKGQAAKEGAADTKGAQHALDKLPGEFKQDLATAGVATGQGGAKGLLPTNRTLQKLRAAVDSGNPLSVKEAFLAFDSAARGGAATQGSIDALTKTLGGTVDQIRNWAEGKDTGGWSAPSIERFKGAINEAIESNVKSANDAHQELVGKYYSPTYYGLKQNVESQMGLAFGSFRDAHGNQVFHVQRDHAAPGVDRTTGKKLAPGAAATAEGGRAPSGGGAVDEAKVARAQAQANNPASTPQQKANAEAWLKSVGR